jgi:hypothetical protein
MLWDFLRRAQVRSSIKPYRRPFERARASPRAFTGRRTRTVYDSARTRKGIIAACVYWEPHSDCLWRCPLPLRPRRPYEYQRRNYEHYESKKPGGFLTAIPNRLARGLEETPKSGDSVRPPSGLVLVVSGALASSLFRASRSRAPTSKLGLVSTPDSHPHTARASREERRSR